ncbi:hypothetical protein ABIA35_001083 [Catenulispora sp. MAP12-49]
MSLVKPHSVDEHNIAEPVELFSVSRPTVHRGLEDSRREHGAQT